MKRKLLIVLLSLVCALCLAFGLTACDSCSGNGGTTDGGQDTEQTGSIADETPKSVDLEFTLSDSGDSYIVSGIGNVTTTTVNIPSTYNGKPVTAIADDAFSGNTIIIIIIIPESVIIIGANAFNGCISLTNVIILGNPQIGSGAFSGCVSIICLTLSDELLADIYDILSTVFGDSSITEIKDSSGTDYHDYGSYVYDEDGHWKVCSICGNKTASESHTLVNDICTVCGYEYIAASDGIEYTLSNDHTCYTVTGIGTCTDTDIVISSIYNGLPVTAIDVGAFKDQTQLTSVYVPKSVASIGNGAFSGCSSLVSMTLPFVGGKIKAKSNVDQYPLGYIFGTSDYTGGTATTQHYYNSFGESMSATYYIPTTLTMVTVTGGNIFYSAFWGCTALTSITIPDSITSIGECAFWGCTSLSSITIPDSVTSIGYKAFWECTSLTSITIPDSITSMGECAFYNTAYYNDSTNWENGVLYIGNYLIKADASISGSYAIKDGTTVIADWAFQGRTSLTSVTIPDSVTYIGSYAFYGTAYYNDTTNWENGVLYIGNYLIKADASISGSYAIKDGTTVIADQAFYKCTSLKSVTIPKGIITIDDYAFYYCSSLTSITIPDSVTSIGNYAFYVCTSLTSITIPDSVTSIGNYAFYWCRSLTSITIPDSVTSIGDCAFYYCRSLTSITIPDSVTSIGSSAFYYCTSLASINVNSGNTAYKSIDGNLYNYDGTTLIQYAIGKTNISFTIPDSVTSIGDCAFYGCTSLTSINVSTGNTSYKSIDGNLYSYDGTILVQYAAGKKDASFIIPDGVISIADYAFLYCKWLTNVTIPNSVTSIGQYAFFDCTSITSVTFENTSGWYKTITEGATSGTKIYLSDTENAAWTLTYDAYYYCYRRDS